MQAPRLPLLSAKEIHVEQRLAGSVHDNAQVLAEKEAWRLAEQHQLDLVAVCPNFIQGPALSPTLSGTSVGHLKVSSCPRSFDQFIPCFGRSLSCRSFQP